MTSGLIGRISSESRTLCSSDRGSSTKDGRMQAAANSKTDRKYVPGCRNYKLDVTVRRCLQKTAPRYLFDCCTPVSEVAGRRQLRSALLCRCVTGWARSGAFGPFQSPVLLRGTLPDRLHDPTPSFDSLGGNYLERRIICELLNTLSAVE